MVARIERILQIIKFGQNTPERKNVVDELINATMLTCGFHEIIVGFPKSKWDCSEIGWRSNQLGVN